MNQIPTEELDGIYTFAISLAKQAGQILVEGIEKRRHDDSAHHDTTTDDGDGDGDNPVEKLNAVDLVTQTDNDVEAFVKAEIQKNYPSHDFIGEEAYSKGSSRQYLIRDGPTWCVDPLDGTVNYIHAFPMFCVSIALVLNGKPIVGVIFAPLLNQLFSACVGRGAYLNETQKLPLLGKAISPMPANAPSGCIFSCEWGKDRRDIPDGNLHRKVESFLNMAAEVGSRGGKGGMVRGVRSLGSATMDLAYTAMGSFDIWWEGGCWEWDVAAGICVLEEAGGLVTTANPPRDIDTAPIEDCKLGGRLYLAIRPAGDGESETARQGQERTVREVWRRVRHLDYSRPGV